MSVIEFLGLNGYCFSNAGKISMEVEISLRLNCLFQSLFASSYYWVLRRFLEKEKHGLGMILFQFWKRHKSFVADVKYSFEFRKVKSTWSVVA